VSDDGLALFGGIVQLGHALGLETVAEGIEDDLQRERAAAALCDRGQGYLFAPPRAAEDIQLRRGPHLVRPSGTGPITGAAG
jgi:EAL domain-containing protein (putative c-di-GMP-specific phosphodiesterase class I)